MGKIFASHISDNRLISKIYKEFIHLSSKTTTTTIIIIQDFPGGAVVKNPPANAGNMGLSTGPGKSHMPRSN